MIDPMANLGNEGFDPTTSNNAVGDLSARGNNRINIHAIHLNNKKIDKVRSFMGIISGCVAGVCGLTGLQGLVCFLALHILVNVSLIAFKMNLNLKAYSHESIISFMTIDLQSCALSYLLFWTLFYGLVYLF
mmetsp:Transcript_19908/g.28323  ORF Transcript_19908/g.28323 Transcript_19908/m.28323 type:complete len:132 (-) Transcript_19908:3-398(-)